MSNSNDAKSAPKYNPAKDITPKVTGQLVSDSQQGEGSSRLPRDTNNQVSLENILDKFRFQTIVIEGGSVLGPEEDARAFGESLKEALAAITLWHEQQCLREFMTLV